MDPSGLIGEHIPCERVIGCVVYPAAELISPGVIKHVEGNRFPVGEPDGTTSERVTRVSECFIVPACRRRCSTISAPRSG